MNGPAEKALQFTQHESSHKKLRKPGHCRIAVIGVGDAGNSTINHLIDMGVTGVECIAINTDLQHLNTIRTTQRIFIGENATRGLDSGGDTNVGRAAIEESRKQVEDVLSNVDVAFVAVGLGGRTGTGVAPVVAGIARRNGAIVIGVVTMPFRIEKGRIECAAQGLTEMCRQCDTVVVIDNNKLRPQLPLDEAFKVANQVLANTINGLVETISEPSLINLDFSSFTEIVRKGGVAVVGFGESNARDRAEEAVRNALRSPLLDVDYAGATGALIHVTGDDQMTIEEANRVGDIVTEMMQNNALVSWSAKVNPSLPGILRVTLMMTGIQSSYLLGGFNMIAPNLYDMDPHAEREKSLHIDLNLDQLENFE